MPSSADQVLASLEEIHALETRLVSTLTAHIAMTPRSEYLDLLERHRYETRTQVQRIERRLTELGHSTSLLQLVSDTARDALGQALALALAPLSLLRGSGGEGTLLRNAKAEAASETLEIVSYDALEAVAAAVGDEKTAVLAREHRTQEERFLGDLRALIPGLAADVVDAEVEGHPRADDAIAIGDFDTLTVEQLLPKLKALSAEELAAVDGYERGGRGRKRVLDRIAALRSKKVDEQLARI